MSEQEPPNEPPAEPAGAGPDKAPSPEREALFRALIGPRKQAYYLSYIRRAESRGYAPLAWHWPAFFLGPLWCLWRRQYLFGAICVALSIVVSLLATGLGWSGGSVTQLLLSLPVAVFASLKANAFYYSWASQNVARAQELDPGQTARQLEFLAGRGGVNQNLPLILGLFIMLLVMLTPVPSPPPS
ncbi:MAG: DUF2628 domain-containing protein [Pseudomonadota bacterium]